MNRYDKRSFEAILRSDLESFVEKSFAEVNPGKELVPGWYIRAVCWQLTRVQNQELTRLVINLPPRMLKSFIASVAWPAFLLGNNPALNIICISYSDELAKEFTRLFRLLVESAFYQRLFPRTRLAKITDSKVTTSKNGSRQTTSIGGTLTGKGADIIIIDDPMKAEDAYSETARDNVIKWFTSTASSRLDNPTQGKIVIVQQRLHANDLSGYVLAQGGWELLAIPAECRKTVSIPIGPGEAHIYEEGSLLDPARLSFEMLERRHDMVGFHQYSAQYLQDPLPPGGNVIKLEQLRYFSGDNAPLNGLKIQSWDVAAKTGQGNDFSACTTVVATLDGSFFVTNVLRVKYMYRDLLNLAKAHAAEERPDVILIEDASSGIPLIQDLQREPSLNVVGIKPDGNKEQRLQQAAVNFETEKVRLLDKASWLESFVKELLAAPNGKHDDQVDSIVQAILWAKARFHDHYPPVVAPAQILKSDGFFSVASNETQGWDFYLDLQGEHDASSNSDDEE